MRKPEMNELATLMFAGSVFFTLMLAPTMFADAIALNPDSLYQGYIDMVGTQRNLAFISLGVFVAMFASFFTRVYNIRILVNSAALVYTTFIAASYLFNYPNLSIGLIVVIIIWQIYEINKLIDSSEDCKAERVLKESLEKKSIKGDEDNGRETTNNNHRSKD